MSRVNARNMLKSLINVLYVNKQEFSASRWRSNQGYTKMHGQPTNLVLNTNLFVPMLPGCIKFEISIALNIYTAI
jgi:hypothetical protein